MVVLAIMSWQVHAQTIPTAPERWAHFRSDGILSKWVKGKEDLLPKVEPGVVAEMPNLMAYYAIVNHEGGIPEELLPDTKLAFARLAELGASAPNALVWLYASGESGDPYDNQQLRSRLITDFFASDPRSRNYALPLLRWRVDWLTQQIENGDYSLFMQCAGEIQALYLYLWTCGSPEDVEAARRLAQAAIKQAGAGPLRTDFPDQMETMQKHADYVKNWRYRTQKTVQGRFAHIFVALNATEGNEMPQVPEANAHVDIDLSPPSKSISAPIENRDAVQPTGRPSLMFLIICIGSMLIIGTVVWRILRRTSLKDKDNR